MADNHLVSVVQSQHVSESVKSYCLYMYYFQGVKSKELQTGGTFDRDKFVKCCRESAVENGKVRQYPGPHSIWILDDARIHMSSFFSPSLLSILFSMILKYLAFLKIL